MSLLVRRVLFSSSFFFVLFVLFCSVLFIGLLFD